MLSLSLEGITRRNYANLPQTWETKPKKREKAAVFETHIRVVNHIQARARKDLVFENNAEHSEQL